MVVHKKCPQQSPTWIAWFWNYVESKRDRINVKLGTDKRESESTTFEEQTTERWPYLWEIWCLSGDVEIYKETSFGKIQRMS